MSGNNKSISLICYVCFLVYIEWIFLQIPKTFSIESFDVTKTTNKLENKETISLTAIPKIVFKEDKGPIIGSDICIGSNCMNSEIKSDQLEKYIYSNFKITRYICILLSENVKSREKDADSLFEKLNSYTESNELPFSFVEFYEKLGVLIIDVRSSNIEYENRNLTTLIDALKLIKKVDILNKADCTRDSLMSEQSVFTSGNIESDENNSIKNWSNISDSNLNRRLFSEDVNNNDINNQQYPTSSRSYLDDESKLYKELDGYFLKKFNEASNLISRFKLFGTNNQQSSVLNALNFLSNISNGIDDKKNNYGYDLFGNTQKKDDQAKITISPLYLLGLNNKGRNITEITQSFKNQTSPISSVDFSKEEVSINNDLAMNIATAIFKGMSDSSSKFPPPFGNPNINSQMQSVDTNGNTPAISSWSYKPIPQGNTNNNMIYQPNEKIDIKSSNYHNNFDNSIIGFNNNNNLNNNNNNNNNLNSHHHNLNQNSGITQSQIGSGLAPIVFESIDTWGKQNTQQTLNSNKNSNMAIQNKVNTDSKVPSFNPPTTSEWMRRTITKQNDSIKQPFVNSNEISESLNSKTSNYFNTPLTQASKLSSTQFGYFNPQNYGHNQGITFVKMNGSVFEDPEDLTSFRPEEFVNKLPEDVLSNMTQTQKDKINLINAFIGTGFDTILQMNNIGNPNYHSLKSSSKRRLFEIDKNNINNLLNVENEEIKIYQDLLSNIDTNQGQDTAMAYVTGCDCQRFPEGVACPMVLSGEINLQCIGYKVWNSAKNGAPLSEVASAIDSAITSKARNIILPLKFDLKTIEENRSAPRILRHIMRRTSKENNILFALPTGNNGLQEIDDSLDFPCDDLTGMYAFCVGSINNKNGMLSNFTNVPQLNNAIYANGEDVESIGVNQQKQLFSGTGIALAQSIGALNIIQGITRDKTSIFDQLAILYSTPKKLASKNFIEQLFTNSYPIPLKQTFQFKNTNNNGNQHETKETLMHGMKSGELDDYYNDKFERVMISSNYINQDIENKHDKNNTIDKILTSTTTKTIDTNYNNIINLINKNMTSNTTSTTTNSLTENNNLSNSINIHNSFKAPLDVHSIYENNTEEFKLKNDSENLTNKPLYKESNYNPEIIGVVLEPKEIAEMSRLVHASNEYYDNDDQISGLHDLQENSPKSLCYEEETRFYSPLEMAIPVDNIEQCILSCSNTPDCRFYSYGAFLKGPRSIVGTCILMPDKQGSVALPNFQSGSLGCPVSASIAYAEAMEERLMNGISNVQVNRQKNVPNINNQLHSDWPGILSTSTVAVKSMSGFLSRFPLNDILQTSISLYNSGFLDQKGALRPSGAFEKQSVLPPPGVGSPHVVCTLQGMQCCVPQKSAKGWRKKAPSFLRVDDPSCEAIYVSKTDMFCATTSLYDDENNQINQYYNPNQKSTSGNCGMIIIETSEHLIFQNTLKMPSKEMNNALCECKLNKRDKSIHGSGTWEYSVQAVQAAMNRKVEGDQLSTGVAQALAWVEAVGNDPNPAVNGLGELISQVAQRPNSDVELITQIPAISQNAVSNMLYNQQQQQQYQQQLEILKQQQLYQQNYQNNMNYNNSYTRNLLIKNKNIDNSSQENKENCITSWPDRCQVWKSKCEDNLIYGYKNPICAPLTILEDGCPMKQIGFKVNHVNSGLLSFSFKPMKFSDNSPFRIACQFSLIKCSIANIVHHCHIKSKNHQKNQRKNESNIRKHKNTSGTKEFHEKNHINRIPFNYLPYLPENDVDENIVSKYIRVHFPQAGNYSNVTMIKLFNNDTNRDFAAKIINESEIPKNETVEDIQIDENSNFQYLGKVEIVPVEENYEFKNGDDADFDIHKEYTTDLINSVNISEFTTNTINTNNKKNVSNENNQLYGEDNIIDDIYDLNKKQVHDDEVIHGFDYYYDRENDKIPLLLDRYQPDISGEYYPEFKMQQIVIENEDENSLKNDINHFVSSEDKEKWEIKQINKSSYEVHYYNTIWVYRILLPIFLYILF